MTKAEQARVVAWRLRILQHAAGPAEAGPPADQRRQVLVSVTPDLDPSAIRRAVYRSVDDAGALSAGLRSAGVSGRFFEPQDYYGHREGAPIDRDGSRMRFGSRLRRETQRRSSG